MSSLLALSPGTATRMRSDSSPLPHRLGRTPQPVLAQRLAVEEAREEGSELMGLRVQLVLGTSSRLREGS
ncbi:hypothetical protein E2C01_014116 [Portunus trituberculatus]|uniref:Uncharacterized protein n=1 Tax=Portunus trituberculatus TaxID=210409 RepID=A0A5B7DHZ2_PORTR|nr:hypothetical protein [Portunus trituberculatus]